MADKQYNTTWYQLGEEPHPGMPCPKCKNGVIDESQYGGYWCKNCKWKWKLSKYPPKQQGVEVQRGSTHEEFVKAIPVTKDDLTAVWDEIEAIKKRLDLLAKYNKQLAEGKTPEIPVVGD